MELCFLLSKHMSNLSIRNRKICLILQLNAYRREISGFMPSRKSIWSLYFQRLKIYGLVSSRFMIWNYRLSLSQDHLIILGSIFSCMWKYYWRCVIDERPWQTSEIQSLFLADHDNIITKYRASVASTDLSG
jgi:hypothetical protein